MQLLQCCKREFRVISPCKNERGVVRGEFWKGEINLIHQVCREESHDLMQKCKRRGVDKQERDGWVNEYKEILIWYLSLLPSFPFSTTYHRTYDIPLYSCIHLK